jgi:ubiquinone/menaquinone biosynthesis C-methylase UbiE
VKSVDVESIKQRQAHCWGMGDYAALSRQLAPAAEALADACAVSAGQEVLDVGAGDGNFALACAREGASVVASDISPGMVERGRRRAAEEGYDIEWVEADVEALPFEDARFDCAGSVFGAFLAPRPEVTARELFRVVRPGGTVGLTAWVPGGVMADQFAIGRRYAPPQPDMPRSEEWGDEEKARARLEQFASHVEYERRSVEWRAESAESFAENFVSNVPSMAAARAGLPADRFEQLAKEMSDFIAERNMAGDGSFRIEAEYAVIVARKPG